MKARPGRSRLRIGRDGETEEAEGVRKRLGKRGKSSILMRKWHPVLPLSTSMTSTDVKHDLS